MSNVNHTIDTLIKIDKNARAQVIAAKEEAQGIVDEANQKRLRLQAQYEKETNDKIKELRSTYKETAQENSTGLKVRRKILIAKLSSTMQNNREQWEDEIIARIITR